MLEEARLCRPPPNTRSPTTHHTKEEGWPLALWRSVIKGVQKGFRLMLVAIGDLCEQWSQEVGQGVTDIEYYDEQTRKKLDPQFVINVEREEFARGRAGPGC